MLLSTLWTLSATCAFNVFSCLTLSIFCDLLQSSHICSREYAGQYPHSPHICQGVCRVSMASMKFKAFDKESFFKALADRTRLRLLNLLRTDELCVCFFVEVLKTNQPKISRHL